MKTYWLEEKEYWSPVSIQKIPELAIKEIRSIPQSHSLGQVQEIGRVPTYSPITFKDVARRSIANSPIKSTIKVRSNSAGAVCANCDPADVFGSLVLEDGDSDERSQNSQVTLPCTFRDRSTTSPSKIITDPERNEVSMVLPTELATPIPRILSEQNSIKQPLNAHTRDQKTNEPLYQQPCQKPSLQLNTHQQLLPPEPKYEYGKVMHVYAKKLEKEKELSTSKSDANLCGKKESTQMKNKSHHHHHHQCCPGYGDSGKHHRFRSTACIIS